MIDSRNVQSMDCPFAWVSLSLLCSVVPGSDLTVFEALARMFAQREVIG